MARAIKKPEMRMIVLVDAVNFTSELKAHGRDVILPKIEQLQEFAEYFFVYKLKGDFIGKMGDGFLILCPPAPPETLAVALSCQSFIDAYNEGKNEPLVLNTRIAIHYGLISPPDRGNYVDTNLNLTARLEGATPPNSICVSATLHDIVAETLKDWTFGQLESTFKGLGENKYYTVANTSARSPAQNRRESRLSFYLSTLSALRDAEDWSAIKNTCEHALLDFPGNPEFIRELGYASLILGDLNAAIRQFEQCVAKGYEVERSLLFIGRAHDRMGNHTRALEVLIDATTRSQKPFHALCDIADIYLDRGQHDEAARWAKRSLKVNPRFVSPMVTLISIYLINRDEDSARKVAGRIDDERRSYLRECVDERMQELGQDGYKTRLKEVFRVEKT